MFKNFHIINSKTKTFFKIASIGLFGYTYYNRDICNDFLHNRFSYYFDTYYDKDTNLHKILKDNLDLPIENISDLFNTTVDIKSGLQHNRLEVLDKTKEILVSLNEFSQIKDLKDASEEKINALDEMIANIKVAIDQKNKLIEGDSKIYDNLLHKERDLLDSINHQKKNILETINNLEMTEKQLNYTRKDLKEKLNKETEIYSQMLKESLDNLESRYKSDFAKISEEYQNELKLYKISSDKKLVEALEKNELLKNLSDMTKSRRHYKAKQIELLKEKMTTEYSKLTKQHEVITALNSEHKAASNEYQKIKLEEFNILNIYFSFDKVVEEYLKRKQELGQEKLNEYNSRLYEIVNNQIRPELKEKLLEKNISEMLKIIDKSFEKSEYLGLEENKKFISDLYKSKNAVILFMIKYLIMKQKEKPLSDSTSSINYSDLIMKNYEKLYQLSAIFEDDYTKSLLENSSLFKNKIYSKLEMVNDYNKIKSDLFFDLFFNRKFKENSFILFSFITSNVLSNFTKFWFNLYDPVFNQINETDRDIVKKIKAMSFIEYYLQNENYIEAYDCLKYLNEDHERKLRVLSKKIEVMTKHEIIIDLLENHFAF